METSSSASARSASAVSSAATPAPAIRTWVRPLAAMALPLPLRDDVGRDHEHPRDHAENRDDDGDADRCPEDFHGRPPLSPRASISAGDPRSIRENAGSASGSYRIARSGRDDPLQCFDLALDPAADQLTEAEDGLVGHPVV